MKLSGANLGDKNVEYNKLSNIDFTKDEKINEVIQYLENLYFSLCQKKDKSSVSHLSYDENGKVILKSGMVFHICSSNMDILRTISEYGILASEWFSVLESEKEGRFCTFVSRIKEEGYPHKGSLSEDNFSVLNQGNNIVLFFDDTNPIFQYLMHLDYFEYENIKKNHPEEIEKKYTKEEIELFDSLIEPLSPAGKNMRQSYDIKFNYWSAIPGGIPSFLVNGICIKNENMSMEEIEELSKLFPNATIFGKNLEVIRLPYEEQIKHQK